jgi:hypothetical protein
VEAGIVLGEVMVWVMVVAKVTIAVVDVKVAITRKNSQTEATHQKMGTANK